MNIVTIYKIGLGLIASNVITENIQNNLSNPLPYTTESLDKKITILMTQYNEEETIQKSLESLVTQNYYINNINDVEIMVVSGYSTDNSENIIQEMSDNYGIKYMIPPYEKKSLTPSRNYGIQNSIGEIIVNVDADTVYHNNFLDYLLKPFHAPNVVGVTGLKIEVGSNNFYNKLHTLASTLSQSIKYIPKLDGCVRAFNKEIYYMIGGLPEAENQYSAKDTLVSEEVEFSKKMSLYGNIIYEPRAIGYHYGTWKYLARSTCNINSKNQYCNDMGINKIGF